MHRANLCMMESHSNCVRVQVKANDFFYCYAIRSAATMFAKCVGLTMLSHKLHKLPLILKVINLQKMSSYIEVQ